MFKKLLSYFVPITIHKRKSSISKAIEVTWANGQMVLDSQNTNYSFGSLQRILRKGLKEIGYEKIKLMSEILVLGVAGGSVIKTISEEIGSKALITGVEIDPAIIEIANSYFGLNKIPNVDIVIDDGFEFILKTKKSYDLIIIDIFQDTTMPAFLFEDYFTERICNILKQNGYILFNTMILKEADDVRNVGYIKQFSKETFLVKAIPRIERHNEVIIVQKLN
jgi:spermidine synthase